MIDRDASSTDSLLAVKIPLFALNAEDDPVAVENTLYWSQLIQSRSPSKKLFRLMKSEKMLTP